MTSKQESTSNASGGEKTPPGGVLGLLSSLYGWLGKLENLILILFLAAAIVFAFAQVIIERFKLGAASWIQPVVYHMTFYLGLVGAVVATRHSEHISIDVASRILKNDRVKHFLRSVLFIFGTVIGVVLVAAAYKYVYVETPPDKRLMPTLSGWWWGTRLWKIPYLACFGLMTFHFAVNAIRSFYWGVTGAPITEEMRVH